MSDSCVAICSLGSDIKIKRAAIHGPCRTKNLGIENIVKFIINNPKIRYLILAGRM